MYFNLRTICEIEICWLYKSVLHLMLVYNAASVIILYEMKVIV